MQYLNNEEAADNVCKPTWIHLNHLVSYCTKSVPGLEADIIGEDNGQASAALSCNRQYCVFRLRKR